MDMVIFSVFPGVCKRLPICFTSVETARGPLQTRTPCILHGENPGLRWRQKRIMCKIIAGLTIPYIYHSKIKCWKLSNLPCCSPCIMLGANNSMGPSAFVHPSKTNWRTFYVFLGVYKRVLFCFTRGGAWPGGPYIWSHIPSIMYGEKPSLRYKQTNILFAR